MTAGRVLVVGSLNEDMTLAVVQVPRPGETVLAARVSTGCGGKGANQAVAAARAGAAVRMVGAVGDDAAGERLLDRLRAEGIDVSGVTQVAEPTGLAVVAVADDGENSIIVAAGANQTVGPATVAAGLGDLTGSDIVVAQGEVTVAAITAAAVRAAEAGACFVLNLAPPVAVDLAAITVGVLVVNEHEVARLVTSDAPEEMAAALAERFGGTVVVTLGEAGAIVAGNGQVQQLPSYPPDRVVDTTGAGDAFVGALAAALAQGQSVAEAVRWGAAAGSITVAVPGAQGGRATVAAIRALVGGA